MNGILALYLYGVLYSTATSLYLKNFSFLPLQSNILYWWTRPRSLTLTSNYFVWKNLSCALGSSSLKWSKDTTQSKHSNESGGSRTYAKDASFVLHFPTCMWYFYDKILFSWPGKVFVRGWSKESLTVVFLNTNTFFIAIFTYVRGSSLSDPICWRGCCLNVVCKVAFCPGVAKSMFRRS